MSKWTFYDPVANYTYTCAINPNAEQGQLEKTLNYAATAAQSGGYLVYEGQDQVPTVTVSGTILSESQYTAMLYFYNLRHQFLVTDDLDRQRWVYVTQFQPTRVRSALYPWKYTFQLTMYVLKETLDVGGPVFNNNPQIG